MDCDECGKVYKNRNLLYQHKYIVHRPPVKCPFRGCNKLMKKASLKTHMTQQHDATFEKRESKFDYLDSLKCPEKGCTKTFETRLKLYNHIYYTHKEKEKCSVKGCNAMVRPHNMKVHIKSHNNPGYTCRKCGAKTRKGRTKNSGICKECR